MITASEIKKSGKMGATVKIVGYMRFTEDRKTPTGQHHIVLIEMAIAGETIAGKVGGLFVKENYGELKEIAQGSAAWRIFKESVQSKLE
jgi:hypothetical protein